MSLINKDTKLTNVYDEENAIFKLYSLGVVTNRDEWVYDFSVKELIEKVVFFIAEYTNELERVAEEDKAVSDNELSKSIKWTRDLKKYFRKHTQLSFDGSHVIASLYRPYVKKALYYDAYLNEMRYQIPNIFLNKDSFNYVITYSSGQRSSFAVLVTDHISC